MREVIIYMQICPTLQGQLQPNSFRSTAWTGQTLTTRTTLNTTEPFSHYSLSGQLILPQHWWLNIDSGVLRIQILTDRTGVFSNPHHSDVDLKICRNMFGDLNHCATANLQWYRINLIFGKSSVLLKYMVNHMLTQKPFSKA